MTEEMLKWLETPEPTWQKADLAHLTLDESFVSGDRSGHRLNVRYYQTGAKEELVGKVVFGPGAQGPPDHAHGGAMAALLDDAMGGVCWLASYPVVAVKLDISFSKMLPLETPCLVEAHLTKVEGRKVATTGRICSADRGVVYTEGTALFVTLGLDRIDTMSPKARAILEKMNRREGR